MASAPASLKQRGFLQTSRRDRWWGPQLITAAVLLGFIVYATWTALFGGEYYHHHNYLSPFVSPEIFGNSVHSWFGPFPAWWPEWLHLPAILILWAPGGFRFTCYYYRGAYYKAIWQDPPGCAVGEARKCYLGENSFPLIFQNIHRYFLYVAIAFIGILAWDAIQGFIFATDSGGKEFGIGVGSLVLTMNVILLGGYTFGCHSFRHLVGGNRNTFSDRPSCKKIYDGVSCLNRKHMVWAWCSLFWVAFSDVYVRLCAHGVWTDWRII